MKQDTDIAEVTLAREHKHAGKTYPAGATLPVPAHDAEWLKANGIAKPDAKSDTTSRQLKPA